MSNAKVKCDKCDVTCDSGVPGKRHRRCSGGLGPDKAPGKPTHKRRKNPSTSRGTWRVS